MVTTTEVRGLPRVHDAFVQGAWLPGELLGTWRTDWPTAASRTRLTDRDCDVAQCRGAVLDGSSVVLVHQIDWAARVKRLEVGVARDDTPGRILDLALVFAYDTLNLQRIWS